MKKILYSLGIILLIIGMFTGNAFAFISSSYLDSYMPIDGEQYFNSYQDIVDYIMKTNPKADTLGYSFISLNPNLTDDKQLVIGPYNNIDGIVWYVYGLDKASNKYVIMDVYNETYKKDESQHNFALPGNLCFNKVKNYYVFRAYRPYNYSNNDGSYPDYYETYFGYIGSNKHIGRDIEGKVYLSQERVYKDPGTTTSNINFPLSSWYEYLERYETVSFAKTSLKNFKDTTVDNSSGGEIDNSNQTYTLDIYPSSFTLNVGETDTAEIYLNPTNSTHLNALSCISDNSSIATGTINGDKLTVKGLKAGTTTLRVSCSTMPALHQDIKVTVKASSNSDNSNSGNNSNNSSQKPGRNEANKIELSPSTLNLTVGEEAKVSFKIISSGSDDIGITNWYNDDYLIASAPGFGGELSSGSFTVYANGVGTGKIRVVNDKVSSDRYSSIESVAYVTVNVTAKQNNSSSNNNTSGSNSNNSNTTTPSTGSTLSVYRLNNRVTGEHLYTTDANEASVLSSQSTWDNEGIAWKSPTTGDGVYRLYSPATGAHLYTKDTNEVATLRRSGWSVDNNSQPLFYSSGSKAIYRLYNPGIRMHLLTTDKNEYDILGGQGWNQEGIALYGN